MESRSGNYSEAVVLRVNELFHDLTSEQYQRDVESEMLVTEGRRWKEAWKNIVLKDNQATDGISVLDIGTGTGFVPLSIAEFLTPEDHLVCSDVSASILEIAKQNLTKRNPECGVEYVKLSTAAPFRLPFEDTTFDAITMNSVLHHLKDTEGFLAEINRILKPGGHLLIGHEPNRRFRKSLFLRVNFQCMRFLFLPREAIVACLRKTGLYGAALKVYYSVKSDKKEKANEIADKINQQLIAENLLTKPLRPEEIPAITDIRDGEGFDPETLLSNYHLQYLESYNHLLTVSVNKPHNTIVKGYSGWLREILPRKGATFFAVYRKGNEAKITTRA